MTVSSMLSGEKQGVLLEVMRMGKKYHWKITIKITTGSAYLYSV